jgi:hypothetical protein
MDNLIAIYFSDVKMIAVLLLLSFTHDFSYKNARHFRTGLKGGSGEIRTHAAYHYTVGFSRAFHAANVNTSMGKSVYDFQVIFVKATHYTHDRMIEGIVEEANFVQSGTKCTKHTIARMNTAFLTVVFRKNLWVAVLDSYLLTTNNHITPPVESLGIEPSRALTLLAPFQDAC